MLMNEPLRIHVIQHVAFEGPAAIEQWIHNNGHHLSITKLYLGESLPSLSQLDWLIVMGGPMGVKDFESYPWLIREVQCIQKAIDAGKCVLGICLGAQLIAATLGSDVKKNNVKEIGWFPIYRKPEITDTLFEDIFPEMIEVFHWHGDTFDIPLNATPFASSTACANQGFILNNRIIGLQFHLESIPSSVANIIHHCSHELDQSQYVQSKPEMLVTHANFHNTNNLLFKILDKLVEYNHGYLCPSPDIV